MWFSAELIVKHRAVVCCWMQTERLSLQWLITLPHVHLSYTNLVRLIFFTSGSLLVILLELHLKMSDLELFGREETMQECTWLTTTEKKKSLIVKNNSNCCKTILNLFITMIFYSQSWNREVSCFYLYITILAMLGFWSKQWSYIYMYWGQISSPPPEIRYQAPRAMEETVDCKRNWPESFKPGSSVAGFQDYVKYRQIIY